MGSQITNRYSFSKLENFNTCPRNFYYTYVLKQRTGDNEYSYLGSICHEILEELQKENIDKNEAYERFENGVELMYLEGLRFMSDNVEKNYLECMRHFFNTYERLDVEEYYIEEEFNIKIKDVELIGYVDLHYIIGDTVYIVDYKTSSKFQKKDLKKKSRQLFLYALALQEKYPGKKFKVGFNMLKYAYKNGKTLVERNKLNGLPYEVGMMWVDCNQDDIDELKEHVTKTVEEINKLNTDDINEWKYGEDPRKSFFCRNLCKRGCE